MLELKSERNIFKGRDGKEVNYIAYYVELKDGIKVYLKPNDTTGKQLLDLELSKKGEQK